MWIEIVYPPVIPSPEAPFGYHDVDATQPVTPEDADDGQAAFEAE